MIFGFGVVILGAESLIRGASALAKHLKVSELAIALTVVAFGTSLPELFVNLTASVKGEHGIALGNVVGSNIFNVFFILGSSSVIQPISFDLEQNFDVGVSIVAGLMLLVFMMTGKRRVLDRWESAILVLVYVAYIALLVIRAGSGRAV